MTRISKKEIKEFFVPGTFTGNRILIKKRWKSTYYSDLVYIRRLKGPNEK
jgi:hypothetical protein